MKTLGPRVLVKDDIVDALGAGQLLIGGAAIRVRECGNDITVGAIFRNGEAIPKRCARSTGQLMLTSAFCGD